MGRSVWFFDIYLFGPVPGSPDGGDGILTRTLSTGGGDALRPSAGLGGGDGPEPDWGVNPPGLTDRSRKMMQIAPADAPKSFFWSQNRPRNIRGHLGRIWAPGQGGGGGIRTHDRWVPRAASLTTGPRGVIPLGDRPPGESFPWGIIPLGETPPGESSPRGIIPLGETPLGNRLPGESFPWERPPWGILSQGNHSPGRHPPRGIAPLGNHSPGESPPGGSFPWGITPWGITPWGIIPLGNHSWGGRHGGWIVSVCRPAWGGAFFVHLTRSPGGVDFSFLPGFNGGGG